MPTCTHPQIASPCADDGVSVGQVLGTSGDVAFDESGSLVLTEGQTEATINFGYQKESADYRFEYHYVKTEDDNPADVRAVVNSQTTRRFTVAFTGEPITANSTLYWRVVVPDSLHACPSAQSAPRYAIVRATQEGTAPFPVGQDFVVIEFPLAEDDEGYDLLAATVENEEAEVPQVFPNPTVTSRSLLGLRLDFGAMPIEEGYVIHWKIG